MDNHTSAKYNYLPEDETTGDEAPYAPCYPSENAIAPSQIIYHEGSGHSQPGVSQPVSNMAYNSESDPQNPQVYVEQPITTGQPVYNDGYNSHAQNQGYPQQQVNGRNGRGHQPMNGQNNGNRNQKYVQSRRQRIVQRQRTTGDEAPYAPCYPSENATAPSQIISHEGSGHSQPGISQPVSNMAYNSESNPQNPQVYVEQPITTGQPVYNDGYNSHAQNQGYPQQQVNDRNGRGHQPMNGQNNGNRNQQYVQSRRQRIVQRQRDEEAKDSAPSQESSVDDQKKSRGVPVPPSQDATSLPKDPNIHTSSTSLGEPIQVPQNPYASPPFQHPNHMAGQQMQYQNVYPYNGYPQSQRRISL